jgi:uncharacterized protein YndB with AHSA1/START domain
MPAVAKAKPTNDRELVLTRLIDAPRESVFRCWTEAELFKQWIAPLPYTTTHAELDARTGGSNSFVMRSPEGEDMPMRGVYLEVVKNEKIVFTDAYTEAWQPTDKPFFTCIVTLEDEDGPNGKVMTRYTARARHWTPEDCEAHVQMGFHEGWGQVADQLAALAAKL